MSSYSQKLLSLSLLRGSVLKANETAQQNLSDFEQHAKMLAPNQLNISGLKSQFCAIKLSEIKYELR